MVRNKLHDLELVFICKSEKAVCVENSNDEMVWLPLSQIEVTVDLEDLVQGNKFELTVPEWLVEDKELI